MNNSSRLFWGYIKLLFGKFFFWVFLFLDGLGLYVGLFRPESSIPSIAFWGLAFVGLIIANFQIFQELAPSALEDTPKLILELVEGSGFEYRLQNDNLLEYKPAVPNAFLRLRLRIKNLSYVGVRILAIRAKFVIFSGQQLNEAYETTNFDVDGVTQGSYPIVLDKQEVALIDLTEEINFSRYYNPAQFAGRITQDAANSRYPAINIELEAQAPNGEVLHFGERYLHISLMPLLDLYTLYWKEQDYLNLIEIANVEPAKKVSSG